MARFDVVSAETGAVLASVTYPDTIRAVLPAAGLLAVFNEGTPDATATVWSWDFSKSSDPCFPGSAVTGPDLDGQPSVGANVTGVYTMSNTGVDYSSGKPTLLPIQMTVAPNFSRGGFYWQNQSSSQIQIILDHDLTGANYSVILADPGASANRQGGDGSFAAMGIRHYGQIRIGAAAGALFAAVES